MPEANPDRLQSRAPIVVRAFMGLACAVALNVGAAENPVVVESLTDEAEAVVVDNAPPAAPGRIGELRDEVAFQAPVVTDNSGLEEEYQIQLLQQEVSQLRGLIEELSHAIDTTKRLSDDRYLELDARFQALRGGLGDRQQGAGTLANAIASASTAVEGGQTLVPGTDPAGNAPGAGYGEALGSAPGEGLGEASEQSLYDTALELIRNRQYEVAITQLQAMIDQHPEGELAPNGYYWLGEVHAAMPEPNYEQARQALAQVLTFFPEHNKVPAAAFKIGKVYHLMGDCGRAVETLRGVIKDHPGKSVGKLAEAYLRDKVDCGQS